MNINLNYYRTFYYVAKYQNITLAANALMCNQPNITRTVRNLEGMLGCTLFARSNRGVTLTPEGERLYSHVKLAMEQIELAETELSGTGALQSGVVAVGATDIALLTFLLPVLNKYRKRFPGIRLNISNYTITQAVSALRDSLVDIAVVATPTGTSKGLISKKLKEIREVAVCGPSFPELAGRNITLRELEKYPLISLGARTRTYEVYSQWFSRNGLSYSPVILVATADQVLPVVRNNLGIGFVPEDFIAGEGGQGVLRIPLAEEPPRRFVVLLKRQGSSLSAAAKALETLILEEAKLPAAL